MDTESKVVVKFLEALASSKHQFAELAQRLRSRPNITRVLHSLECLQYETHVSLEGYVDIELSSGKAVALWLEVTWNDKQWTIESRVLLNDNQPQSVQEVIREFPDRTSETLDDCIKQLLQATSDLVNSADPIINSVI